MPETAIKNAAAASACVICAKPQSADYRPFCSKRCADVDLNRWLGGVYAIPAHEDDEEDALPPALQDDGT